MPATILSLSDAHTVNLEMRVRPLPFGQRRIDLEVWRSVLGEGGPYEPLFSPVASPARVPSYGGDRLANVEGHLVTLDDQALLLRLRDTTLSYTYPSSTPVTLADFANALHAAIPQVDAWVDDTYRLVLQTTDTGALQTLEILPSEAALILGLPTAAPASLGVGFNPPIRLMSGQVRVSFRDLRGSNTYFYKVRYAGRDLHSDFSAPISGLGRLEGPDPADLALGWVRLTQGGVPSKNTRVAIFYPPSFVRSGSWVNVSVEEAKLTDTNGYAEFTILRDTPVDVAIAGTGIVRRVKLPRDTQRVSFDLLDPALAADDGMSLQQLNYGYADRRS